MKYFKSENTLIQFNPKTDVYKIRNDIKLSDKRVSADEFLNLNSKEIKKQEFCRLMNEYFKNVKHSWEYQGVKFRKLDNFEASDFSLSTNYDFGNVKHPTNPIVPFHEFDDKLYFGKMVLVYHWGQVYYHTISYNGYKQGQLVNPKTKELVQWAQLKNCAPIFNEETNQIV